MIVDDKLIFAIKEMMSVLASTSSYLMLPTLVVGLGIAIFQAATQINEQSLSFIPKLIVLFFIIMGFGAALIDNIARFSLKMIEMVPSII